jgi:hypothetical protein
LDLQFNVVSKEFEKRKHGYQFLENLRRRVLEQRKDMGTHLHRT